jgi:hypothetical protein
LAVTGGTVTLTSTQAANTIQEYTGVLTSNQIIIVPSTVQLYAITNNTTGTYTLIVKTTVGGASTVSIGQGLSVIVVCDGSNVFNANSGAGGSISNLTLNAGSVSVPPLNFVANVNTGLYLPASEQIGFTLNGVNSATLASTGFSIPVGISGGTF